MIDGGATLARRLDRYRSAIRAPARDAAAPPTDDLAGRLATGGRRRDRPDVRGCHRPSRDPVASPAGRSGPARDAARTAAGGRPARLPRHRDDRAGHGGRHAGLAHRARLVGGGPLPPGPAPAAGQRRGALPAGRARGDDPRRWLARHLQRARLRLAAAGGALPARATGRPGPRRSSRPAPRRPAPVPSSHGRRPASDRRGGAARAPSRRRRRGLGDPRSLPRVPPRRAGRAAGRHRPPQRPGRPLAGSPADADRERIRDPRGPADACRSGTWADWRPRIAREGRLDEALACYDVAIAGPAEPPPPTVRFEPPRATGASGELPWWSPRVAADFGGPRPAPIEAGRPIRSSTFASSWTPDRIAFERAHLLRRLKRWDEAVDAWTSLAAGPGRDAIVAAIELAKIREHRLRDPLGALHVAADALDMIERRRRRGRPEPRLEADLLARSRRLRRRLAARDGRQPGPTTGTLGSPAHAPLRP